ncbi:hypothetical protein [Streptosporangium roseum]|uniref:Uncharacterized protein n=1 Tax=Streptosporangium roseum (strain ATCC 12428 / DSM 43021 / JCM 3005 / KCTC 9067 / NCIMB 10171 / NRRL 2505 / NI 9100) TaxID=479432 RepID=D2B7H4_STRRD|nr:hypothetical protein [Streptosporangium roseum]ACZ91495.1 hypothetical protein Sros_8862 [Streptosporangium roseum DSM 43021]
MPRTAARRPLWSLARGDHVRGTVQYGERNRGRGMRADLVGHVLAKTPKGLNSKSAAAPADQVLPALTAAMGLLKQQDPAEADTFRRTVIVAIEAAACTHQGQPSPALADMTRKITAALDAA